MASRLDWLHACKLTQLEAIARATGINSSGTKPILIAHLQDELSKPHTTLPNHTAVRGKKQQKQPRKDEYNIFSIDMGIRNLAYCQLLLPPSWLPSSSTSTKPTTPITPTLLQWSRIDVSQPSHTRSPTTITTTTTSEPTAKESFSPSTYAPRAHTFLTTHILPHNPTHILIERQRFRSMGGSAVQEWTLRVNMFEAMLYATLQTYSALGTWPGEVVPVLPGKVAKYWLEDAGKKEKGERMSISNEKSKARKMDIVRDMVQNGWAIESKGEAKDMGNLVIRNAEGKRGRGKEKGLGKFDDLADCLLQGLAWVKWEENKRLVWEKGLEALEELAENKMGR